MRTRKILFASRLAPALLSAGIVFSVTAHAGAQSPPQVLTLQEVAALLRVPAAEVEIMARNNELPGRRIGSYWRFHRGAVMAWLAGEDPVEAALAAEASELSLAIDEQAKAHVMNSVQNSEQLSLPKLSAVQGRGTRGGKPGHSQAESKTTQPKNIGEKPKYQTAEQVFLRDQAILLKPRQITLELGLGYARSDQQTLISQLTPLGLQAAQIDVEQDTFSSNYTLRYGVLDDMQLFASAPLIYQSTTQSFGGRKIADTSETYWGGVTTGVRYTILHEGWGYPSVILGLNGVIPIQDAPWGAGGSIALVKSVDPAVLFASVGFQHYFNGSEAALRRLQAENQVNALAGIAYALNDTLTLSTAVSGVFNTRTRFDNGLILPKQERYSLRFALTSFLTRGLFIEPSVSFGLNGNSSNVAFGLNLPYTFNIY